MSTNRILAWLMNATAPLEIRMIGDNPNRRTVENVVKSGLMVKQEYINQ